MSEYIQNLELCADVLELVALVFFSSVLEGALKYGNELYTPQISLENIYAVPVYFFRLVRSLDFFLVSMSVTLLGIHHLRLIRNQGDNSISLIRCRKCADSTTRSSPTTP